MQFDAAGVDPRIGQRSSRPCHILILMRTYDHHTPRHAAHRMQGRPHGGASGVAGGGCRARRQERQRQEER